MPDVSGAADGGVHIVPYASAHREALLALIEATPAKRAMWDWQYANLPEGEACPALVLKDGERVLGFNGVMPVSIWVAGRRVAGLWSCDFYLDAACRGKGFGAGIKDVLKRKSPLIMSFGISDRAALVLERAGWTPLSCVSHTRKVRRLRGLRCALYGLQWFNMLRHLRWRFSLQRIHVSLSRVLPDAAEVDALWQHAAPGYGCAVERNYAYLYWRYESFPGGSYRFLVAAKASGELCGIAVVREAEGVLRIVDLLAEAGDIPVRVALVRAVLAHYPSCNTYVCTTSDEALMRALGSFGFYVTRDRPRFFVWGDASLQGDELKPWLVMAGDSDGEMLAAANDAWGSS